MTTCGDGAQFLAAMVVEAVEVETEAPALAVEAATL